MNQTAINVWFVCKLCRGSFRQVDDFIEHKKEEHFAEFQNTSCIVFEETEYELQCPIIIKDEILLTEETNEPPIKIEVTDDDPAIIPFKLEVIDEPNLGLVELKSELITFEGETISDRENSYIRLIRPKPNPCVLIKRITSQEIQRACEPKQHCRLLKYEQKTFANDSVSLNTSNEDCNISDHAQVEKSTEIQSTATVINVSTEQDLQFECKLCSKQLQSDGHLLIHVRICALYHKDRNRFCVTCNTKLSNPWSLKHHCLTHHGTEEEKASLHKFKCHLCAKQFQTDVRLKYHLETHTAEKQEFETSKKSKSLKCSQPNCGKEFNNRSNLRRHTATHFGLRPFSCSTCNRKFTQKYHLKDHLLIHTGERPYKCTVDNCNKAFTKSYNLSIHCLSVHRSSV